MTYSRILLPFLLFLFLRSNAQSIPDIDSTVQAFMAQYQVPGMAIAITHHGKLVYACNYGYADTLHKIPVNSNSLFRIASVSKCITATAILKLMEAKQLSLDDTVFGPRGVLAPRLVNNPMPPTWKRLPSANCCNIPPAAGPTTGPIRCLCTRQ